jgi:hypothetical protein
MIKVQGLNEDAQLLLSMLERTSFSGDIRACQNRGHHGATCLGVVIYWGQLFEVGFEMARALYKDLDPTGTIVPVPEIFDYSPYGYQSLTSLDDVQYKKVLLYWPTAPVEIVEVAEQC